MGTKTPALSFVTRALSGVSDTAEGMRIMRSLGLIPPIYGVGRYFVCDGEYRLSPDKVEDLILWGSIATRRIRRIENIAIEAMLASSSHGAARSCHPCIVWGFGLEGWIRSGVDAYGVRLVSVNACEAVLSIWAE